MPRLTKSDKAALFLQKALNKTELPSKSRKYRKFDSSRKDMFYWVGKAGGVRVGRTASEAISITRHFHLNLRKWETKNNFADMQNNP